MRKPDIGARVREQLAETAAADSERLKRRAYRDTTICLAVIVWMTGWAVLTPHAWRTGLGPIALVVSIGAALWLRHRLRRAFSGD